MKNKFKAGKDWVWYAPNTFDVYGEPEIKAVLESLRAGWLALGNRTRQFEDVVAKTFGKKYGLFVNSGSSANLTAISLFHFPKGSEVITPACTFSTTLNPILQNGLKPVFIDVIPGRYVIDPADLSRAYSKKTVAIMLPHLIGNFFDIKKVAQFCWKHHLVLIEDSCDTIGGKINGKPSGIWSDVTTTSFYASHVITAGGAGGMVMVKDKNLWERARVIREWGRGISRHDEKIRSRLAKYKINGRPYDSAFVFPEQGYNFKPTEMQAAFALSQLRNLDKFIKMRAKNFEVLTDFFKKYEKYFILPRPLPNTRTNWLAYPLTIKPGAPFGRNQMVRYLEDHKIQTRPIFSGNILRHPAYRHINYRKIGDLKNSTLVMNNGFLIGMHHGLTEEMLNYVRETMEKFLEKK